MKKLLGLLELAVFVSTIVLSVKVTSDVYDKVKFKIEDANNKKRLEELNK